jgi:hypothetical protein
MTLLIIGGVFILLGFVWHFIEKRMKKASPKKENKNEDEFFEILPTDKFEELKMGDFVEFSPDLSQKSMEEYMVTSQGDLLCLHGVQRNFMPNGQRNLFFVLGNEDYIVVKFHDGQWMAFDQKIPLEGDAADEFNPHGIAFSKKGQIPESYSFTWRDMQLSVLDVGYLEYRQETGNCDLPDQTRIKFMLAKCNNGAVFYLENRKTGPDCVRIGHNLGYNLDEYLGKITKSY